MVTTINSNPYLTTNAPNTFNVQSEGYIQGTALNDPAIRNALAGGYLDSAETLPMWGGVGVSEYLGGLAGQPIHNLGNKIGRASTITVGAAGQLTGFSVFDQNHAAIITPQSEVPLSVSGMQVNFYRIGSGARIPVAIDPALVSLEGGIVTAGVSWDFALQRLIPGLPAYGANVFTALTRANVGGNFVATATTTSAHGVTVGSDFTTIGNTPAAYNGTWKAIAGTTGSTLVWSLGTAVDPGADTVLGSLVAGGGLLVGVEVLDINIGNSMTVKYDPVTGFATWNRGGSCAVILI